MDRAKLIDACAQNDEDRVLLARVWERMARGEQRGIPAASCFLSPREQVITEQLLSRAGLHDCRFFGGTPAAERKVCLWLPDYCGEDWLMGDEGPVAAFRATFFEGDKLTHRDFLGSLMGSGIKRETVGDIYVGTGTCDLLVLREIVPYVRQNLLSAGRTRLSVAELPLSELSAPEPETKTVQDTVAALRLDSVLSAGFRLSRGKAAALIEAGRANVNHLPCLKPATPLSEGDTLSLQGHGKLRLAAVRGSTKKGRIAITLELFR